MFYKALGFAVWKGAKWYMGRRMPSRRLLMAGGALTALAVVASVIGAGAKRGGS